MLLLISILPALESVSQEFHQSNYPQRPANIAEASDFRKHEGSALNIGARSATEGELQDSR